MNSLTSHLVNDQVPAGEIVAGQDLVQIFEVLNPYLSCITPILATHRRRPSSELEISVYLFKAAHSRDFHSSSSWDRIVIQKANKDEIWDNEPFPIFLPSREYPVGSVFKVSISSSAAPGDAFTAWLHTGVKRIVGHIECRQGEKDYISHGLLAELSFAPPFSESDLPLGLLVSPVTQCNLNCIHCISRITRKSRNILSLEIRENIRKWCHSGKVLNVATDYSGDLLWADAHFGGEVDFIAGLQVPYHIDTNGVYLTDDVIPKLLSSRLASLNVSLDAATEESYRRIRRGSLPLFEVLNNVGKFGSALCASDRARDINFSLSFTLMRSTLGELPAFVRIAARLGVPTIYTRHLEVYTPDMENESLVFCPEQFNLARAEALALAIQLGVGLKMPPVLEEPKATLGHMPCPGPWRSAVILGNGDVSACCVPGMVMGNLKKETMEEIWQGKAYQTLRRTVNSTDAPRPCSACPMYRRNNNRHSYLHYLA